MNTPHPYDRQLPKMLREEIQRIFLPLITQQLLDQENQMYLISIGTLVLKAVRIEFRSISQNQSGENLPMGMVSFRIECVPEWKYEKIFSHFSQKVRWSTAKNYTVRTNKKIKRSYDSESSHGSEDSISDSTMVISGEIYTNQASEIADILGELGMFASEFDTNEVSTKIGFITGNQLGQDQKIPMTVPLLPKLLEGVSLEVLETIEEKKWLKKKQRMLSRNAQLIEEKTNALLHKVRDKNLFSVRDDSYVHASQHDNILLDYQCALGLILPDQVCQSILGYPENSVFEIQMWHKNLSPLHIHVGEFNKKYAEWSIGFTMSIKESDADKIWNELAENFKKNSNEIGDYEVEVNYPIEWIGDTEGEASIVLEMPIGANDPGKIREVLYLFWRLLFEYEYPITQSPKILPSFENSNLKFQKLAKSALKEPKISSPSNR